METKNIHSRLYFCFTAQTNLNQLHELAEREVDALYGESQRLGLQQTGPLEFIYLDCTADMDKLFTLIIALPIKEEKPLPQGKYTIQQIEGFKCLSHVHQGSLAGLYQLYGSLYEELTNQGAKPTNQSREIYQKFLGMDSQENITEIQLGIS